MSPAAVLGEADDTPGMGEEVADKPRPGRVLRADWDALALNPNIRQVKCPPRGAGNGRAQGSRPPRVTYQLVPSVIPLDTGRRN